MIPDPSPAGRGYTVVMYGLFLATAFAFVLMYALYLEGDLAQSLGWVSVYFGGVFGAAASLQLPNWEERRGKSGELRAQAELAKAARENPEAAKLPGFDQLEWTLTPSRATARALEDLMPPVGAGRPSGDV